MAPKKLGKNPNPVYVLDKGFQIEKVVVFLKNSMDVSVRAIPDDKPDTVELFNNADPPCMEDFCITVTSFKAVSRWVAHLDSDFWYSSGAAVLLQLSAMKYVFIGDKSFTFDMQPNDEVVEFRVRLEGSLPLAWIHGKNNTYMLSSGIYVPNAFVIENDAVDNPYGCIACENKMHPIRNMKSF